MIETHELDDRQAETPRRRGRPPADVPTARVSIRLPAPLYDAYDRAARQNGEPVTAAIKRALARYATR